MTSCSECGGPVVEIPDGFRCLRCGLRFFADETPNFPSQHPLPRSIHPTHPEVSQSDDVSNGRGGQLVRFPVRRIG